jgi:hypothetical protein
MPEEKATQPHAEQIEEREHPHFSWRPDEPEHREETREMWREVRESYARILAENPDNLLDMSANGWRSGAGGRRHYDLLTSIIRDLAEEVLYVNGTALGDAQYAVAQLSVDEQAALVRNRLREDRDRIKRLREAIMSAHEGFGSLLRECK